MVERGWGGPVATAVGVAAVVGAAQLGLGYGLEIISWRPGVDGLPEDAWLASLAWATWIAATSAVAGAVVADRLSGRPRPQPEPRPAAVGPVDERDRLVTLLWRLVLATAAALGAGITVALTAVPARLAETDSANGPAVAAGYTAIGMLVGLAVAVGALAARAAATNVIATTAWLWLLAVVAVVDGVVAGRDWERVPLAFWEFIAVLPEARFANILWPDALLAAGAALLIGFLAALPAARRGDAPVGVAVSGAAGPLLVAAAYLLSQPALTAADDVDISRHLVAPYLVLAGLIGSLLCTAVRPRNRTVDPDQRASGRAEVVQP